MNTRTITLCLLACLFFIPLFALHPSRSAPLWDHLTDVNVQWEKQITDPSPYREPVSFTNDTERIRTHLSLVEGILRARPLDHLTHDQRTNRARLLDHLREYWQAGNFPRNPVFQDRTPFFIDDQGTACAVGYLLIQDGQQDFALRIKEEMNNAYLLDMPYPEIPAWAEANGFSPEELAWIQPGYAYENYSVTPLAFPDPNAPVHFLFRDQVNDRLIIQGNFTSLNGVNANHIVAWDGTTFTPIGGGISGTVNAGLMYNGNLYLGGNFAGGTYNLAKLTGNTFSYEKVYTGVINALAEWNGDLYIAGNLTHNGGAYVQHILKQDNGGWTSVGQGFDQPVYALAVYNNQLYAGGDFQMSGTDTTRHVAVWNGSSWDQVQNGLDARVLSLVTDGTDLYAGGWIYNPMSSSTRAFGLAKAGQSQWEVMLEDSLLGDYHGMGNVGEIRKIMPIQGKLYLHGTFLANDFTIFGSDMGYWNSIYGNISPIAAPDDVIRTAEHFHNHIVLGGDFTSIYPMTVSFLATITPLVGVDRPFPDADLFAWPQPAGSTVRVALPLGTDQPKAFLSDLSGKVWPAQVRQDGNEMLLERGDLPAGAYLLRIADGDRHLGVAKVIFQ